MGRGGGLNLSPFDHSFFYEHSRLKNEFFRGKGGSLTVPPPPHCSTGSKRCFGGGVGATLLFYKISEQINEIIKHTFLSWGGGRTPTQCFQHFWTKMIELKFGEKTNLGSTLSHPLFSTRFQNVILSDTPLDEKAVPVISLC